jgi:hypothetical protein
MLETVGQKSVTPGAASYFGQDLPVLHELQNYLLKALRPSTTADFYDDYHSLTIRTSTPDNRRLRMVILNREDLLNTQPLYWVGFFGQKKPQIDPALYQEIDRLDRTLLRDLDDYPFILAYGSLELPDRYNYGNLVIFNQPEGIKEWKNTYHHRQAAQGVSPNYYDSVRIHMGKFQAGVSGTFGLEATNFYDFQAGLEKRSLSYSH